MNFYSNLLLKIIAQRFWNSNIAILQPVGAHVHDIGTFTFYLNFTG